MFFKIMLLFILSGTVCQDHLMKETGVVIDGKTGQPVSGALVEVPAQQKSTLTDDHGAFQLHMRKGIPAIMSVKKKGYRPYSLIVNESNPQKPLEIAIQERSSNEILIDAELRHLGDNKFSNNSANAGDFSASAIGATFLQEFYVDELDPTKDIALIIGSIIGIDTRAAQILNQSNVKTSASSPVKVYFNSQKIGEIIYNGDNHMFPVSPDLVRANRYNIVKIETGVNLNSDSNVDYDDIEFMNLFLDIQQGIQPE